MMINLTTIFFLVCVVVPAIYFLVKSIKSLIETIDSFDEMMFFLFYIGIGVSICSFFIF